LFEHTYMNITLIPHVPLIITRQVEAFSSHAALEEKAISNLTNLTSPLSRASGMADVVQPKLGNLLIFLDASFEIFPD
jgi:hypothetical protein